MHKYDIMSPCIKCGDRGAAVKWQSPSSVTSYYETSDEAGLMLRQCRNCAYCWYEYPHDFPYPLEVVSDIKKRGKE